KSSNESTVQSSEESDLDRGRFMLLILAGSERFVVLIMCSARPDARLDFQIGLSLLAMLCARAGRRGSGSHLQSTWSNRVSHKLPSFVSGSVRCNGFPLSAYYAEEARRLPAQENPVFQRFEK